MVRKRLGRVFVISSPSGGGKTTMVRQLARKIPNLSRSISVTTRAPRRGERDGRDYWFVTPATFHRLRRSRALLEWAKVHGAYYGTPRAPILQALEEGRDVLLSLDVQGARQVRRALKARAVLVFLLPPSLEALRRRLMRRRTDTREAIRRRLSAAKQELTCARWYDHTVINDHLQHAVKELAAIIMKK